MAEYIDRKQAITETIKTYEYEFPTASGAFDEFVTRILPNVLKGIPAADVAPVKHGRWIEQEKYTFGTMYDCSITEKKLMNFGCTYSRITEAICFMSNMAILFMRRSTQRKVLSVFLRHTENAKPL